MHGERGRASRVIILGCNILEPLQREEVEEISQYLVIHSAGRFDGLDLQPLKDIKKDTNRDNTPGDPVGKGVDVGHSHRVEGRESQDKFKFGSDIKKGEYSHDDKCRQNNW